MEFEILPSISPARLWPKVFVTGLDEECPKLPGRDEIIRGRLTRPA